VKRDYLPHELGETTVDAMRQVHFPPHFQPIFSLLQLSLTCYKQIKKAFDPLCLLNCDKVVRVERPKKGEVAEW
jgi:D-lactate dehydrogenase (cytochrome)